MFHGFRCRIVLSSYVTLFCPLQSNVLVFGRESEVASLRRSVSVLVCALISTPVIPAQKEQDANLRIVVLEGDGAINNVRVRPPREPRVRVEDRSGEPVGEIPVTFVAPGFGAGGTFGDAGNSVTVVTGEDGEAAAAGFRPNSLVGQFEIRVSASHSGETARTVITQTNVAPVQEGRSKKFIILGLVVGAIAGGALAATSLGGGSEPASTVRPGGPSLGVSPGNPTFGPPQ
jgi:hypothetical protein